MLDEARADGVTAGSSVESIGSVFSWLQPKVRVITVEPEDDMPNWLRESMEAHHGGFADFEEESRPLVLRASYYFGQSLSRASRGSSGRSAARIARSSSSRS